MKSIIILTISLLLSSCFNSTQLKGRWSLDLQTQKQSIPFVIEFINEKDVILYNGKEIIKLKYSKDKSEKEIRIDILNFDAAIILSKLGNTLKGNWVKYNRKTEYKVPIFGMKQVNKKSNDFKKVNELPKKWKITMKGKKEKDAILLFTQEDSFTHASVLTQTGDYRYLTPIISGDKLTLHGFDGAFAFLFKGVLDKSQTFSGTMYAGKSWKEDFTATPNESFELKDPEGITSYKGDFSKLFLIDLDGKLYNPGEKSDKVKVLQIFGTWCPNCIDETRFITKWREANPNKNVEFYMLAFERSPNKDHAIKQLKKAKKLYNIDYPILIGGFTKSDKLSAKLPGLENFISFPTTIYIDKSGKVRKIHAGFNGPATGKYFDKFTQDFNSFLDKLLKE
jgi:thiol-disulfide isomerase/thioredoxin